MDLPTAIVMIITTDINRVKGGGAPIYIAEDIATLQEKSASLASILDASAHEIDANTIILVSH